MLPAASEITTSLRRAYKATHPSTARKANERGVGGGWLVEGVGESEETTQRGNFGWRKQREVDWGRGIAGWGVIIHCVRGARAQTKEEIQTKSIGTIAEYTYGKV